MVENLEYKGVKVEAGKICSHTISQHLFHNICCNSQPLLKKIAIVALNIITLCIPLIVYNIGYYAVALGAYIKEKKIQKAEEKQKKLLKNNQELKEIEEKVQKFIDGIKDEKIDKEALIFAKQKLSEKPSLDVLQRVTKRKEISYEIRGLETFFGKENEEIVYLAKLYFDYKTKLKETIKAKKNNWDDEVNELAYSCLKIAYTVAIFMLDDNKCFQKYKKEYLEKSPVPMIR